MQWKGQLPEQSEQIPHIHSAVFILLLTHKEQSFFRLAILVSGGTQGKQGMSDGCLREVGTARWLLERKKEERVLGGKV